MGLHRYFFLLVSVFFCFFFPSPFHMKSIPVPHDDDWLVVGTWLLLCAPRTDPLVLAIHLTG